MKKYSLLFALLPTFAGSVLQAQDLASVLTAGTTPNVVYVAPSTVHISGKTTAGMVTPIYTNPSAFTGSQKAAIEAACNLWKGILSFNGTSITVRFTSDALPSSALASTTPAGSINSNVFPYGKVISGVFCPWALANKLSGSNQMPASGTAEIEVTINQGMLTNSPGYGSFYDGIDGNCPSTMYDLETTVFHEIAHGLGIFPSVRYDQSNNLTYGLIENGVSYPTAYDHFVIGNTANSTPNKLLTSIGNSDYLSLTPYLESDNLYWNGPQGITANGNTAPELYAPNPYAPGSSVSHLDISGTDLFNHMLSPGTAIHTASAVDIGILNDIGWDAAPPTSANNYMDILYYGSYNSAAHLTIDPGTQYGYTMAYYSNGNAANFSSYNWSLDVYYDGGVYTVQTGSSSSFFVNIGALPSGYNWVRDENGRVQGYLTATGTTSGNSVYKKVIDVGISAAPNAPYVTLENNSQQGHCDQAHLTFYSPGATSYKIMKQIGNGTLISLGTTTDLSYDVSGLSEMLNYQFLVTANNSHGNNTAAPVGRARCKTLVACYPDPVVSMTHFYIGDDFVITGITLTDTRNPKNTYSLSFDGTSTGVDADLSGLQPGIYIATITSPDDVETTQIEKD